MKNFHEAKWIVHQGDSAPRNTMILARGNFILNKTPSIVTELKISADSRYVVYINGVRVGQGPPRSWPGHQLFDCYDITDLLKTGKNTVAVELISWGESNFQYWHQNAAGLICEITTADDNVLVASDKTWKMIVDEAYDVRSRRCNMQLGFAEIYDAAKRASDWDAVDFDDSSWAAAREIGPAGCEPWGRLSEKNIPHLTNDSMCPTRAISTRLVDPFGDFVTCWTKWFFVPGDTSSAQFSMEGLAASVLKLDKDASALIRKYSPDHDIYINGHKIDFEEEGFFPQGRCGFKAGDNLVLVRIKPGHIDHFGFGLRLDNSSDAQIRWCSVEGDKKNSTGWVISDGSPSGHHELHPMLVGFDQYDYPYQDTLNQACASTTTQELLDNLPHVTAIPDRAWVDQNASYDTIDPVVLSGKPVVSNFESLCEEQSQGTCIEPVDSGDVELLIDFGRTFVGHFCLDIDAPAGAIIDINAAEELHDGLPLYPGKMDNTVRYIAREGRQCFRSFSRHGGRWATITLRNFDRPVRLFDIHVILMTYPQAGKGHFECSDQTLNRIWDMCAYTLRLCSEDTYTDCPTFERACYAGDARNESMVDYVVNGDPRLSHHCMKLAGSSLKHNDIIECIAASGWRCVIPAWAFLWAINCWEAYMYDGDKDFLHEIYPAIKKNSLGIKKHINDRGLFEMDAWNFLDWTGTTMQLDGIATFQQGWCVAALRASSRIAKILGHKNDAINFENWAKGVKTAANRLLWNEKEQAYIDCIGTNGRPGDNISQQTQIVMYLCEMAEGRREHLLRSYLREPKSHWEKIATPFMKWFLLECLHRRGQCEHLLSLIRRRWGAMIKLGATTCLEMFPKPNEVRLSRSNCHAWSTAPGYFLPTLQLGIRPISPGFSKTLIAPHPVDLQWAKGRMPTPHGPIEVSWKIQDEKFTLTYVAPPAVEVQVILPEGTLVDSPPHIELPMACEYDISMDSNWKIDFKGGIGATIMAGFKCPTVSNRSRTTRVDYKNEKQKLVPKVSRQDN